MQIVLFDTPELMAHGLQHRRPIEDETIFVFPLVSPGNVFHSRNVLEPFDLAFISEERVVLAMRTIQPQVEVFEAPPKSHMAIESKGGRLARWGYVPGLTVNF
jgi:uncharacterized membrane protein (UPF0127 family)